MHTREQNRAEKSRCVRSGNLSRMTLTTRFPYNRPTRGSMSHIDLEVARSSYPCAGQMQSPSKKARHGKAPLSDIILI